MLSTLILSVFSLLIAEDATTARPVSYYKDIRPIFQRECHGCHQPAKAKGEYVMTSFDKLLAGGEEGKAVIPGDAAKSYLVVRILPKDGKAEMPKGKKPLADTEIALIKKWIGDGAKDDTPDNAKQRYDMEHPPIYTLPPVITSIDYSPDGQLLAIAGFHEVLLHKADGSAPVARLVGLSERIESVKFSPDGKSLAVTGGLPCRMGEVQVWDVEKTKLKLSRPITYDTVYGASWSPDGKLIAFGCADTTLRAIEAETGKEVLFQGAHDDWVLDTVFSVKGDQVVSVGRDRSTKLTDVVTQRFIDNLTSITPGALKGGLQSVARHPERDQVLVGGADGTPQVYRMLRETKRVIGDNANLIKRFPPMKGRIFSVDYSPDGKSIACVSSHNGRGYLHIYSSDFDGQLTDELKKILNKVVDQRNAKEKEVITKYQEDGVKLLTSAEIEGGLYEVVFHPNGKEIAVAGADGQIRLINPADCNVIKSFMPVTLSKPEVQPLLTGKSDQKGAYEITREGLDIPQTITALEVLPGQIQLNSKYDYVQTVVLAKLPTGDTIDVTRHAVWNVTGNLVDVSSRGIVNGLKNGKGSAEVKFADKAVALPVTVTLDAEYTIDYVRDVMPVISSLGCNAGTCHGAKEGKNGFKLSLRGYDPLYDVRAFTDDHASRRVNVASPDDSLMLMKATGSVPHEGGQLFQPGEKYYETIRQWILNGAKLDLKTARVTSIEIAPKNPIVQKLGSKQQMRVVATYADGLKRDVTREAFISSGNADVATAEEKGGLITTLRRGEAPILARFEGAYIATILTVMGDRSGFVWVQPPANNKIDQLAAAKWNRMKILPSGLCSDGEFIRRVYLDLIGLPPSAAEVESFTNDHRDQQLKRDELIDFLVGSKEYVELWTNKWADLLQVNRKFLGTEGSGPFRMWIRNEIEKNTPYHEFVTKIINADGSNKENPPASYYKVLRDPAEIMENTTHLFLGTRFNCNKCHDHPFERWTQDQYYQTAAYFARVGLKKDPNGGDKQLGRTAVEAGKPLFEIVYEMDQGDIKHDRTGEVTSPHFPFAAKYEESKDASRRQQFTAWLTSPDNPYFSRSYVNRIWGYLTGVGIIEPLDDIRAGNPATNPELLGWLTEQFVSHNFDTQYLIRTICKSRVYQLSIKTDKWNQDDRINYSHAIARRLPAEVLYDTVYKSLGAQSQFPGVPAGTRAAALPDVGVQLPDGFLGNLGRPPRESACECERVNSLQLGPVMALVSGPTIDKALTAPNNILAQLTKAESDDKKLIQALFMSILNREATDAEIKAGLETIGTIELDASTLAVALAAYEKELKPIWDEREKARSESIVKANTELDTYEKEIAPREAELEKEHQEKIVKAEAALTSFEPKLIENLKAWEARQSGGTAWEILDLQKLSSSNGAKMEKQDDQSIFVSGKEGKTVYTFTAEIQSKGITGVRLELLTDKRLPKNGPGRATQNGNYVLTEFEVKGAPKDKPDELKNIELTNANANFSQDGYDVKTAIDGQVKDSANGWATSPKTGEIRIATFETKQDFGSEAGSILSFSMNQQYLDGKHTIGRFRVSITDSAKPFKEGIPKNVADILQVAVDKRDDKQKADLLMYFKTIDPEQEKLAKALEEARKPRPVDPKLKMLQEKLASVSIPLPEDPKLKQLKGEVDLSKQQLTNKRLIAAQDIAWALINNPAFLFNH
ncbi:MAG: DUF1549 domain-containing protein [Planctomycetota bacterium]|nr:DUF1549 domain-containing protein [Planctomycetota bacterium]